MSSMHRTKEDQNFWNFIFSLFFLGVLAAAVWYLGEVPGGYPAAIPPLDVIFMAFATFRITRLIVYDKIARWFRELFADSREFKEGGQTWIEIKPYGSGFRHTVHDLLQCPWCIGIWASLVVVFCYFVFAWSWLVILFLAVAGAGSLLQVLSNLIGWKAEGLRREVGGAGRL